MCVSVCVRARVCLVDFFCATPFSLRNWADVCVRALAIESKLTNYIRVSATLLIKISTACFPLCINTQIVGAILKKVFFFNENPTVYRILPFD